jgi:hypothetical protein
MNVELDRFNAGNIEGAATDPGDVSTFAYADLAAARADEANRTNGDIGQIPTGMVVLSGGVYVPKWVADNGTPNVLATLSGAVLPSAESPAWTENKTGTATLTTDGTRVNFTTNIATDTCGASITNTEAAGGLRWLDGLFRWNAVVHSTNAAGDMIEIKDGVKEFAASLRNSSTPYRYAWFNDGGDASPIAASGRIETGGPSLLVEHRVTIIIDADDESVSLYLNGIPVAMAEYTLFNSDTAKRFLFGDFSSLGTIDLDVRSLAIGVA